ncbi:M48 family metallopeptidase [Terricaulis sp.]|uniref:M48 family metallopeptidase n=1 Tax=Terricaulis sp. TaxID=2768686 RepID=UPI003784A7AB
MGEAYGLQTHIWNNNGKSVLLMLGFPVLLLLLTYGLFLLYAGFAGMSVGEDPVLGYFVWAGDALARAWPYALVAAGVWFAIAYVFYQNIIDAATGAHKVERKTEPKLYNLLENLCISRGLKTPDLRIMETDGMNAFATGLHEGQYSITVTRGLMNALNDEELEAVLAHELTHIRNRDVRLLVIAVVFVGIFSFVGEMAFRGLRWGSFSGGGSSRRSSSGGDRNSGGGAIIAIIVALVMIGIAYALAIVIRFALSRRREYLADAGSVELTKNPDAMISALQKISGNATVNAPSEVREMFIENPHSEFASMFATHPPIQKRIQALAQYAGGRVAAPQMPIQEAAPRAKGPWG